MHVRAVLLGAVRTAASKRVVDVILKTGAAHHISQQCVENRIVGEHTRTT